MSTIGIVVLLAGLSVVGAATHRLPLSWTALGVLGAGVLVHLTAQTVRFREASRRQAEQSSRR